MRKMMGVASLFLLLSAPAAVFAQEAEAAATATTEEAAVEAAAEVAPVEAPVETAAVVATPAAPIAGGLIPAAPADKAQIVFFRPSKMMGAALSFKVREGDVELGKLSNGKYFVVLVEPGAHEYVVHSEAKDVTHMEVEAGETYFVQGSLSMGVLAGRPNLSPSDQAAFEAVSKKLALAKK